MCRANITMVMRMFIQAINLDVRCSEELTKLAQFVGSVAMQCYSQKGEVS